MSRPTIHTYVKGNCGMDWDFPGILPDWMIRDLNIIQPFSPAEKREGKISFGLTSYGYDLRLGYKFKVFHNAKCGVVDPKAFDEDNFINVDVTPNQHRWEREAYWNKSSKDQPPDGYRWACQICEQDTWNEPETFMQPCLQKPNYILIPPNSFCLGESFETLTIPRDILAVCIGKSTMARCGLIVNITPLEPEWIGKVTIEISNTTPLPAKVYAGEGICQVLFFRAAAMCEQSYADKKGVYQGQTGLTLPKVV